MVRTIHIGLFAFAFGMFAGCAGKQASPTLQTTTAQAKGETAMSKGDSALRLGNFSVSLTVKDLAVSKAFYEKLGFAMVGGNGKNWAVMKNETTKIGLFQGMFDKNILTFNPGWDSERNTLPDFDDVRVLQRTLKSRGVTLTTTADENTAGPASFTLTDPDGNMILVDQHVSK